MKRGQQKQSRDDKIFDLICKIFLIVFVLLVFYPIYFILIASFTEAQYVNSGRILLYPIKVSLEGYKLVFRDAKIWMGYANTILYTVAGTCLGTIVTMMAGYALSRKDLIGRGILMKIYVFTMYFSGGIIPFFLVVKNMGLLDTRAIMIILGCVSAYNIIVVRSFLSANIPDELWDAANVDGCGHGRFFVSVVLPLSKAVIAVMVLYIAVSYWNSYFNAMILMTDSHKYPLQLYLRELLTLNSSVAAEYLQDLDPEEMRRLSEKAQVVKYSVIVVATAPILCVYPFIQKYFVKGVMIGSVKG